jgi:hypothetical protein
MGLCEVFMEFVLRFLWGLMGFYEVDGVFFGLDPPNIHLKTLEKQAMFSAVIVSQLIITFQVLQWLKGM